MAYLWCSDRRRSLPRFRPAALRAELRKPEMQRMMGAPDRNSGSVFRTEGAQVTRRSMGYIIVIPKREWAI